MSAHSRRWFLAAAVPALLVAGTSAASRCSVCSGRLSERYWTYDGQTCCSRHCLDTLKPRCAHCHGVIDKDYYESEGKQYCSLDCFEATLPACEICSSPVRAGYTIAGHEYCAECVAENPTCFSCGLPAGRSAQLTDGRPLCARWAVGDARAARANYLRAKNFIETWTGARVASLPQIQLVDLQKMRALSNGLRKSKSTVPARGLYSRQTTLRKRGLFGAWKESPKDSSETIYILDHLHAEIFRATAVHELTHDLIHERFPRLDAAPLWVQEGICQRAAAEYCRRRNLRDALELIETCEDPDYGDGYRHIKHVGGEGGWPALKKWMEAVDVAKLPAAAPRQ